METVQDDASPTPLPGDLPKAKNLLLGEGQSLLRAHVPKTQEPGRRHPRGGRAKTVAAGRELAERAEDETHGGVCVRCDIRPVIFSDQTDGRTDGRIGCVMRV